MQKITAGRYISRLITSLRYHRNMSANPDLILSDPQIKLALANIHQCPVTEDTHIPLTPEAVISMSSKADRDFSVHNTLMAKAALWLAFTCMLCKGEYSHSGVNSNPLKTEHITICKNSLTLHFPEGWKAKTDAQQSKILTLKVPTPKHMQLCAIIKKYVLP